MPFTEVGKRAGEQERGRENWEFNVGHLNFHIYDYLRGDGKKAVEYRMWNPGRRPKLSIYRRRLKPST